MFTDNDNAYRTAISSELEPSKPSSFDTNHMMTNCLYFLFIYKMFGNFQRFLFEIKQKKRKQNDFCENNKKKYGKKDELC